MLKKIIIGLSLVVISGATTANAALLTLNDPLVIVAAEQTIDSGDVHNGFDLDGFVTGSFYQFVANITAPIKIDVTPNQATGNVNPSWISNLVMTWDWAGDGFGNGVAHQITDPITAASTGAGLGGTVSFFHNIVQGETYRLFVTYDQIQQSGGFLLDVSAVPLPPAVIAFSTAMLGVGFLARRRRKQKALFS